MTRHHIAGSEADRPPHERGFPIVHPGPRGRHHRRSWLALIGAAVAGFVSLYLGKPE